MSHESQVLYVSRGRAFQPLMMSEESNAFNCTECKTLRQEHLVFSMTKAMFDILAADPAVTILSCKPDEKMSHSPQKKYYCVAEFIHSDQHTFKEKYNRYGALRIRFTVR